MDRLALPRLAQFAAVEAALGGSASSGREYDWRGEASADVPLVGVAFLVMPAGTVWCKSERPRPGPLPLRLSLGWYDAAGRDVRVHWSVGEGQRVGRTLLASPATPKLALSPEVDRLRAGHVERIFTLPGEPAVTCWALVLPAASVRVGGNGLWNLRPREREAVPEPLRGILSYGRTGALHRD